MKEVITTPGKYQVVRSENGCTVTQTLDNGQRIEDNVPAGESTAVFAFTSRIEVDDDSAVVREVFKLAPYQKLRLLGVVGGGVPAWLKQLNEELANTVGTGRFALNYRSATSELVAEIAYPDLDGTAKTAVEAVLASDTVPAEVSATCVYGVTPYVVDYLLHDFTWEPRKFINIFPNANYPNGFSLPADMPEPEMLKSKTKPGAVFAGSTLKSFPRRWTMEGATEIRETFQNMPFLETLPAGMTFEKVKNAAYAFTRSGKFVPPETLKLTAMQDAAGAFFEIGATRMPESMTFENVTQADNMCWNNPKPLRDISTQANFGKLQSGSGAFNYARFTKVSALRVLNTIPSYTSGNHPLTIGIHIDHKTDDEVLAAIANAEAKGWTLTVQWNGTPTAQASVTYGLRTPPIYARVSELENGERYLDWGHYVTDPTLYEEFRSVEAAREYYGLPAEDLTNN